MSLRRVCVLAALALAVWLEISCGQVYRPVVIPTSTTPPDPANFHAVFGISANVPFNPGTALQIDVAGDTVIGVANMGVNPTHATIIPNNSRVIVASAGSLFTGDADLVTVFSPAAATTVATGLGAPFTFTLPYGSLPVFVNTSQSNSMYVANYGTNSVTAINFASNLIGQSATVGLHPVALAETPDGQNLYVVNQGSNTVTDLSTTDLSTLATIPVGSTPVWAVARPDSLRVYAITQGDSNLYTIRTDTNAIVSTQSVGGPGANFALYDKSRNRLYVTNPGAAAVYVFDATTDPPTPIGSATGAITIAAPPIPAGTAPCVSATCSYSPVIPVSVTALPDGSRFYVASYVTAAAGSPCPDPSITAAGCIIPQVTVFDANNLAVKTVIFPLLPTTTPVTTGFALAPVAYCAPLTPYAPTNARFRMSAASAENSSRAYASMCDDGSVAIINTTTSTITTGATNTPDTLVYDLPAPFSAGVAQSNGEPPLQNPIFLVTGQ